MEWRDTNIDAQPKVSACTFVHTVLWYNAIIAFSTKSDAADNSDVNMTKTRPHHWPVILN